MGNGTKIGLVLVLVLVVVVFANLLDSEVQRGPNGVDQAPDTPAAGESTKTDDTDRSRETPRRTTRLDAGRDERLAARDGDSTTRNLTGDSSTGDGSTESTRGMSPSTDTSNRGNPSSALPTVNGPSGTEPSGADDRGAGTFPVTGRTPGSEAPTRPRGASDLPESPTDAGRGTIRPATSEEGAGSTTPTSRIPIVGVEPGTSRTESDPESSAERRTPAGSERTEPTRTAPPAGFPKTHEVVDGDSLWQLADSYYSRPTLFTLIIEANPGIGDGSELKVGQKLKIPAPPASSRTLATKSDETTPAARPAPKQEPTIRPGFVPYIIEEGDTLYDIADIVMGEGTRWPEIVAANPGIDPARLQVGKTIQLPK